MQLGGRIGQQMIMYPQQSVLRGLLSYHRCFLVNLSSLVQFPKEPSLKLYQLNYSSQQRTFAS